MNFTQMYESFQALENPSFWQDIYMRFYRAWFEGDRWMQYFEGLGTTIVGHHSGPAHRRHPGRGGGGYPHRPTTSSAQGKHNPVLAAAQR